MTIEYAPDKGSATLTPRAVHHEPASAGLPFPCLPAGLASSAGVSGEQRLGRIVSGRYRLESPIAAGPAATLYCAMDLIRQERCVVKLLRSAARSEKGLQRALIEREAARRLFHPNIVSIYEYREDADGTLFMVMELLTGCSLQELLQESGVLPFARALEILREVGAALEYMHSQGLVHLSVQPDHIFLPARAGEAGELIKLIGFGQTQLLGAQRAAPPPLATGAWREIATPYMAPELSLEKDGSYDSRADQWSLAVLAYRLFSGREPFQHAEPRMLGRVIRQDEPTPLHQLCPTLPAHVCHAVQMALTKRREHRFERVCDFVRALEHRSLLVEPVVSQALDRPVVPEKREVLQTVQCLRSDLIAMTKSEETSAVPEPIEAEIPTERYSNMILSEALRLSGDENLGHEAPAQLTAPALAPSVRPPQRSEQVLFDSRRPLHWAVAAFSIVFALGTIFVVARSLGARRAALAPRVASPQVVSVNSGAAMDVRAVAAAQPPLLAAAGAAALEPARNPPELSPLEDERLGADSGHPAMDDCAAAALPSSAPPLPRGPVLRRGELKPGSRRTFGQLTLQPSMPGRKPALPDPAAALDDAEQEAAAPVPAELPSQPLPESRIQLVD